MANLVLFMAIGAQALMKDFDEQAPAVSSGRQALLEAERQAAASRTESLDSATARSSPVASHTARTLPSASGTTQSFATEANNAVRKVAEASRTGLDTGLTARDIEIAQALLEAKKMNQGMSPSSSYSSQQAMYPDSRHASQQPQMQTRYAGQQPMPQAIYPGQDTLHAEPRAETRHAAQPQRREAHHTTQQARVAKPVQTKAAAPPAPPPAKKSDDKEKFEKAKEDFKEFTGRVADMAAELAKGWNPPEAKEYDQAEPENYGTKEEEEKAYTEDDAEEQTDEASAAEEDEEVDEAIPPEFLEHNPELWEEADVADMEPLAWDQAREKALKVIGRMDDVEVFALLRGTHFNVSGMKPNSGYYVGNTKPLFHWKIPSLKMQDAGNGFRPTEAGQFGTTTSWPCMLAMASTWDDKLVYDVAEATAREFRGKGANVMLGPSINVHRSSMGGRNFEYLSGEDPFLGSRLTTAHVEGVQSQGVLAVVKHFAFNEQETNRFTSDSVIDERTAWTLYYPPFEAAVKAGAGGVMCAYNKVNGTPSCGNQELLRRDLRGRMGFKGMVLSDWYATPSTQVLLKGMDMEMPGATPKAVNPPVMAKFTNKGLHRFKDVETREAALHVLTAMFHSRIDEQKSCTLPCNERLASIQRTEEHVALAQHAAASSVTLLQNDGVLPIDVSKVKKILVLGKVAIASKMSGYYSGGGSGNVPPYEVETPFDALKRRGQEVDIEVIYEEEDEKATEAADRADVVIVVAGAVATEGADRNNLNLDQDVNRLISAVAPIKPTIVLMETPGAVLTPWRNVVSAAVNIFLGGERSGSALASVVFGDVNPSGKLPIMFPATENDVIRPSKEEKAVYHEGIFTSYRSNELKAAYPFGHGLSYTQFRYDAIEMDDDCDVELCIRVNVTNVGKVAGAEVPQVYISFKEKWGMPKKLLKGFFKTQVLKPGEMEQASFTFTERDLSLFRTGRGWVRPFSFALHVGASSSDIRVVETVSAENLQRYPLTKPVPLSQKDGFPLARRWIVERALSAEWRKVQDSDAKVLKSSTTNAFSKKAKAVSKKVPAHVVHHPAAGSARSTARAATTSARTEAKPRPSPEKAKFDENEKLMHEMIKEVHPEVIKPAKAAKVDEKEDARLDSMIEEVLMERQQKRQVEDLLTKPKNQEFFPDPGHPLGHFLNGVLDPESSGVKGQQADALAHAAQTMFVKGRNPDWAKDEGVAVKPHSDYTGATKPVQELATGLLDNLGKSIFPPMGGAKKTVDVAKLAQNTANKVLENAKKAVQAQVATAAGKALGEMIEKVSK